MMKRFLLLFTCLAALSACAKVGYFFNQGEKRGGKEAYLLQQTLLGAQNIDPGRVHTVRLLVNGQRVEVTSQAPSVIASEGEEQERFVSLIVFSPDYSHLIFFTRSPENGQALMQRVLLAGLGAKPSFTFPIVTGPTVSPARIEVLDSFVAF
ncbi:MAG: hypothetical protein AB7G80_03100 [Dongiaceae bacterium]